MDLRRVNLLNPLPLTCTTLPGAWNCSSSEHSVWTSEKLTWPNLRLGLVAKFGFGLLSGAAKGFRVCCGSAKSCYW
jgi:hypothetical protein